ncbi:MAG: rhodanese-like domain-containing protein [Anaerolineales bacterium]
MSKKRRKKKSVHRNSFKRRYLLFSGGLVIVLSIVTVSWLFKNNNPPEQSLPGEINVVEAARLLDSGAFILDVRQPEEWQQYHIPGSTLIPLDQLEMRIQEIPKNQAVVVVCRQGNRSLEGRDILLSAGFDRVTSMAGGLLQWHSFGYSLNLGD